MKSNHVPANQRIRARIAKLEIRQEACWLKTRRRFYQFCRYCDLDVISVNMNGHARGCPIKGLDKQVAYYKGLLQRVEAPASG